MKGFNISSKFGFFLYAILIPIMFVFIGRTTRSFGVPLDFCQLAAQISVFIIMIPYFLKKKDYFKTPQNILLVFLSIFLIEITLYFLLAANLGSLVLLGIPLIPILRILEIIIFAPIIEEMYFRGILQDCLDTLSPTTTAFTPLLSSCLFGLVHVRYAGTYVIFMVATLGFISSMLLKRYKNLYPSIFLHGIYNWMGVFLRMVKVVQL